MLFLIGQNLFFESDVLPELSVLAVTPMFRSVRTPFCIALYSLIVLSGSGCENGPLNGASSHSVSTASQSKSVMTVATTTGMVADIVRQVAGPHANVVEIIK